MLFHFVEEKCDQLHIATAVRCTGINAINGNAMVMVGGQLIALAFMARHHIQQLLGVDALALLHEVHVVHVWHINVGLAAGNAKTLQIFGFGP